MNNNIFNNESGRIENMKESARELGADIGSSVEADPQPRVKAKRNCKNCWGKGWATYSFPGNKGNTEAKHFYCACVKFI